jgi:YVTN family beta-propeller protein
MPIKYSKTLTVAVLALSAGAVVNAQTVTKTITVNNLPEQLAVDPVKDRVYVAVPNFGAKPYDYLTVIDGKKDTVIENIEIPPVAYAVAVDPIGRKVYVGGTFQDENGVDQSEVVAYCLNTNKIDDVIPVSTTTGDGIQGLAVNQATGEVYVSNGSDNEIDVIKFHTNKVAARIPVSGEPFGVTVNPLLNTVYAALLDGSVSVINGATNTVTTTTIIPPVAPITSVANAGISVDIGTGNVYVTNATYSTVSSVAVLSSAGAIITNINVGNTPIGIDVDPFTGLVFEANTQDGTFNIINASTNTVSKTLSVSGLFVAANVVTGKVYVGANDGTSTVTVISEK